MRNNPIGSRLLVVCLLGVLAAPVCASAETIGEFPFLSGKRIEKARVFKADFERTWDAILRAIEKDHEAWKKLEGQRPDMKWDVHADKKARLIVLQVAYDKKNKQSGPVISTYTFLVEPIDLDHTRVHCHNVCRFRNVKTGEIGNPFLWVATPGYFDMAEKAIKERQVAR